MYDYIRRRDEDGSSRERPALPPRSLVRRVEAGRILDWLSRGAGDIVACRGRSLAFGLCYVAMGHAVARARTTEVSWLDGFASVFLFAGPLLAVGIYELSRQRERAEPAELLVALFAWCRNPRGLCLHAGWLALVLTLWLQLSWALLGRAEAPGEAGAFLLMLRWVGWLAFAALAFVSGVVAVPMLLDRVGGVTAAVSVSLACCIANPLTMTVWAVTIALLVGVSLWLGVWPLLFVGPWIGHATWHVYRDCVGEPPGEPRWPPRRDVSSPPS